MAADGPAVPMAKAATATATDTIIILRIIVSSSLLRVAKPDGARRSATGLIDVIAASFVP
jgi:hypothetical protein